MKNWKLVIVAAASLSALVFSAACTVEEGDVDNGGAAGSAGQATAGAGGAAAGAGGAAAGAAGASAALTYADFFTEEGKADSACTLCIRSKCSTENAACGDPFVAGGVCTAAVTCLTDGISAKPDNYDCSFESCVASNPTEAVNDAFTCTGDKCATECGVTAGFGSCP